MSDLSAPFPWFGGKSRVAADVWARFGDVPNYVEPFFGSGAVLLGRPHDPQIETVNDLDGFVCVAPDTRLLNGDLSWVRANDVRVGQELIGFDESNGEAREGLRAPKRYRHWCQTVVTGVRRVMRPCYRLTFDDGTTVIASADHLWLGGSHKTPGRGWRWLKTSSLVCNRATQRSWILKLCDVTEKEETFDAGWLAGFCDGEGHINTPPGCRIAITQRLGDEANKVERLLSERNFQFVRHVRQRYSIKHSHVAHIEILGGIKESMRFLMLVRPERLIRNFLVGLRDVSLYGRSHQAVGLVSKEYLGEQEVVAIETTSKTFVAEGLASHNCNFWRSLQAAPDEVARWADWPVNENDLHARHAWLVRKHLPTLAQRLEGNPDYYDAKIAGWWVWGICSWIGSGWCSGDGPWQQVDGVLVKGKGEGVRRQRPHLGDAGQGVNRQLPVLSTAGREALYEYMRALSARLRRVRVCCGDWSRVCGPSPTVKLGMTGVFLDPPYSDLADRDPGLYSVDSLDVAHEVRTWALEHGDDPLLRIALCGYTGEHDGEMTDAGWTPVYWKAHGGYGSQGDKNGNGRANAHREVIWFSPRCLQPHIVSPTLFDLED